MKRQFGIVVVLLVVGLALAAVVFSQHRQIAQMKAQLALAAAATQSSTPAVHLPIKVTPTASPEVVPSKPPAAPATATGAKPKFNFAAGLAGMLKNPQMQEMMRAQQQVMINQLYGSLSNYLNLPADQKEALNTMLLDRQMAMAEAGISAMNASAADQKQVADVLKSIKTEYDADLQHLLGPQDYHTFQDYEKTTPERVPVAMFKGNLSEADALSVQQENALVAAMSEERLALPASSLFNNQTPGPQQYSEDQVAATLKQMDQLQQRYATRAAALLTPAQLEQFVKFQGQFRAMQEAGMKMAAQMFSAKGAAPAQ